MQGQHDRCPDCGNSDEKAVLGDGRLRCRHCGRKFTWRSAWDSIRLPDEVKRSMVLRFVRNARGHPKTRVPQPSVNTCERIRQLCRAACALQAGIAAPWEDVAFKLADADRREVQLVGLKFMRKAGLIQVAGYSGVEASDREQSARLVTAHIGAFQSWGKQRDRVDLWLRRHQGRVITSDVQHELVRRQSDPEPEAELRKFAEGVGEFLRHTRSVESRYLHLYVGEAWVRCQEGSSTGRIEYAAFRRLLMHHSDGELSRVIRGS